MHSCSVNSFQKLMYHPTFCLWIISLQLVKIKGVHKGNNVMCTLMHNRCPFFMRKFLPFLLVIYFSAGSLSTQLRALQSSSVGEKYLQVIRISFFELRVPVFLQCRRKRICVNWRIIKHLYSSLYLPTIKNRAEMKSMTEFPLNSVVSIIEFFINIYHFSPSAIQQRQNSLCN